MRRARSLDPLAPRTAGAVAGVLFYRGDSAAAASELGLLVEKSPEFAVAHYGLGRTWTESGRYPEAIAELRRALELSRDNPAIVADLARALALSGDGAGARRELEHWQQVSAGHFERKEQKAHVLIALGEKAAALPLLEQALEERSPGIVWLAVDPRFAPLRGEPAFLRLLERARLRVVG
jgi:Flp pilus assembly protein TadD